MIDLSLKVEGTGKAYFKLNRVSIFRFSLIGWKRFHLISVNQMKLTSCSDFTDCLLHHYLYQWLKVLQMVSATKNVHITGFTLIPLYRQSSKYLRRYNIKNTATIIVGVSCKVEIVGVEPTTLCLQSRCSSQLSYTPVSRLFLMFQADFKYF